MGLRRFLAYLSALEIIPVAKITFGCRLSKRILKLKVIYAQFVIFLKQLDAIWQRL
jgi:hypothetical protein